MALKRILSDLGERGILVLCGIMLLTFSLGAVDWRVAGTVVGAIMVAIALVPLFVGLFRGPPRQGGQG